MFGCKLDQNHGYLIDVNTKLVTMYYNEGKPNLFRVHIDVTLSSLKNQLDQINSQMDNDEYPRP